MTVPPPKSERDPGLRAAAAAIHGLDCKACGLNFGKVYDGAGEGYIEVHHVIPVAEAGRRKTDPEADLTVLCANWHRITHRRRGVCLSLKELKAYLCAGDGFPQMA